jgi:hypothetical protein
LLQASQILLALRRRSVTEAMTVEIKDSLHAVMRRNAI